MRGGRREEEGGKEGGREAEGKREGAREEGREGGTYGGRKKGGRYERGWITTLHWIEIPTLMYVLSRSSALLASTRAYP